MDNLKYKNQKPTRIITLDNAEVDFHSEVNSIHMKHLFPVYVTVTNGSYQAPTTIVDGGEITVTIAPSTGYVLPDTVTVEGASSSFNTGTGVITITEPEDAVYVSAVCLAQYSIEVSVTNGSYTGDALIVEGKTASVTISPIEGYELPSEVTVTGATASYDSETGVISLSEPTDDVVISATCEESQQE